MIVKTLGATCKSSVKKNNNGAVLASILGAKTIAGLDIVEHAMHCALDKNCHGISILIADNANGASYQLVDLVPGAP